MGHHSSLRKRNLQDYTIIEYSVLADALRATLYLRFAEPCIWGLMMLFSNDKP